MVCQLDDDVVSRGRAAHGGDDLVIGLHEGSGGSEEHAPQRESRHPLSTVGQVFLHGRDQQHGHEYDAHGASRRQNEAEPELPVHLHRLLLVVFQMRS